MARKITIEYGGKKYHRYPDSKRRQLRVYYWRHDKWKQAPVALHRQIYIDNFGPIPKGFHIHHKDGDTENNSPDNLQALSASAHAALYTKEMTAEQLLEHKKKMSEGQLKRLQHEYVCENCRRKFQSRRSGNVRYCSKECAAERNRWWEKAIRQGVAKCEWCDGKITNRGRYCSKECREKAAKAAWSNEQ